VGLTPQFVFWLIAQRPCQTAHGAASCLLNCHLVGENAQNPPKKKFKDFFQKNIAAP